MSCYAKMAVFKETLLFSIQSKSPFYEKETNESNIKSRNVYLLKFTFWFELFTMWTKCGLIAGPQFRSFSFLTTLVSIR